MTEEQTITDSAGNEVVINEALSVIDAALARMMQRELVSSGEVADLLLDVRMLLTTESDPV
jgi:hypothetical protein